VALGLSIGVFVVTLPILMVLALLLVGFGGSTSSGEDLLINLVSAIFFASWVGIPVSLIAIALKSARTEKSAAAAWIGAVIWLAVTVWFYFTAV
jgi:hypothetical protein